MVRWCPKQGAGSEKTTWCKVLGLFLVANRKFFGGRGNHCGEEVMKVGKGGSEFSQEGNCGTKRLTVKSAILSCPKNQVQVSKNVQVAAMILSELKHPVMSGQAQIAMVTSNNRRRPKSSSEPFPCLQEPRRVPVPAGGVTRLSSNVAIQSNTNPVQPRIGGDGRRAET